MKAFLSYPSEHLAVARDVYEFLRTIKVDIWFDKESLIGGQHWDRERARAQREADLTILVLSPETIGRPGVIQRELHETLALLNDQPLGHIYLVVLRTEDLVLPTELEGYQYIDLFRPAWQFKLARSISLRFEQLQEKAPAPLIQLILTQESADNITLSTINERMKNFEIEADYFLMQREGVYWNYVNAEIVVAVFNQYFLAKRNSEYVGVDRNGRWSLQLESHFVAGDLVSLKFFSFLDLGGAHPTRGIFTRNFGGALAGKLELRELFGHDSDLLRFMKQYVELDVRKQCLSGDPGSGYKNPEYDLTMYVDERDYGDQWEAFSQWNFNEAGITINLSQYSGLPFVMGVFEVIIPWHHFVDKIAEEFVNTDIGRFILSKRMP